MVAGRTETRVFSGRVKRQLLPEARAANTHLSEGRYLLVPGRRMVADGCNRVTNLHLSTF